MRLLTIAIESNPKESSKVLKSINSNDIKISKLLSKIKISLSSILGELADKLVPIEAKTVPRLNNSFCIDDNLSDIYE